MNIFPQIIKFCLWSGLLFATLLSLSCAANPLNKASYERYRTYGSNAERDGDWSTAERAYHRAAEHVYWGNLDQKTESEALYNLGRAKRKIGELDASEEYLKKALAIDEKIYGPDHHMTGATLSELAATYFYQRKYDEGIPLLIRLEPIAKQHSGKGRTFIKTLFEVYSEELAKLGREAESERFMNIASAL